jgi:hypothetical protein
MSPVNILQMQSSCGTVEPARSTALGGRLSNLILNAADIIYDYEIQPPKIPKLCLAKTPAMKEL